MNKEEINELRSFDERLKQKLTPEEYELITSWR